jgi:hypothetical protein
MTIQRSVCWRVVVSLVLLSLPLPGWAYVDPNAGGWLFQLIFPLLMAIAGVWAVFKQSLRNFWDRLRGRRKANE